MKKLVILLGALAHDNRACERRSRENYGKYHRVSGVGGSGGLFSCLCRSLVAADVVEGTGLVEELNDDGVLTSRNFDVGGELLSVGGFPTAGVTDVNLRSRLAVSVVNEEREIGGAAFSSVGEVYSDLVSAVFAEVKILEPYLVALGKMQPTPYASM